MLGELDRIEKLLEQAETGAALELLRATRERFASSADSEAAEDVRTFVANVRPLRGCCVCEDDDYYAGRAVIEQIARTFESENVPAPSPAQCLAALEFLSDVEPIAQSECFTCGGGKTAGGFHTVLHKIIAGLRPVCDPDRRVRLTQETDRPEASPTEVSFSVLAARAILETFIQTIPDERGDERFVLWSVRDKLNEAIDACEQL